MGIIKILIGLPIFLVILIFAFVNNDLATFNLWPFSFEITFIDKGIPYDPLAKPDPDVTLSAAEREIGGLGIFMVKQTMDAVEYEYKDGSNILPLVKNL